VASDLLTAAAQAGQRGMTPRELTRLLRVSLRKVLGWIHGGQLGAVNVGDSRRPRFIVLPSHLEQFERGRRAVPTAPRPAARRRRRPADLVDFYPD
jgi:excisionase family DNA binding protein